jgi:ATP-binding cassette subfamily B protein
VVSGLITLSGLCWSALLGAAAAVGVPLRWQVRRILQTRMLREMLTRTDGGGRGRVGEMLSTLRDDVDVGSVAIDWPFDALAATVFAVGGFAVLLSVSVRVTLLVFVPLAVVVAVAQVVRGRLVALRVRSRTATARVTGSIADTFRDVEAVQALGLAPELVSRLRRLNRDRMQAELSDQVQNLGVQALFQQSTGLGAGVVLLVALHAFRVGVFTVGDFALFAIYLQQVAGFTGYVGYLVNSYRESRVSFGRMEALIGPEKHLLSAPVSGAIRSGAAASAPLARLVVEGLQVDAGVAAVTCALGPGELGVVVGAVGSGKTRFLMCVLGLAPAVAGAVWWNGVPLERVGRERLAFVPEAPHFLSGTVLDNIAMGRSVGDDTLARVLDAAALSEDLARLPDGLLTQIGPGGLSLSGGQRKRVGLARALAGVPDLLVLDGLEAGLDGDTAARIVRHLRSSRMAILAATHDPEVVSAADVVIRL